MVGCAHLAKFTLFLYVRFVTTTVHIYMYKRRKDIFQEVFVYTKKFFDANNKRTYIIIIIHDDRKRDAVATDRREKKPETTATGGGEYRNRNNNLVNRMGEEMSQNRPR